MNVQFCLVVLSLLVVEINGNCSQAYSCQRTKQQSYVTKCGWLSWSRCTRYRTVTYMDTCYKHYLAVDGIWADWGSWIFGVCSATCGQGLIERRRERVCELATDTTKIGTCTESGEEKIVQSCLDKDCPVIAINGGWSDWKPVHTWSACSVSCGEGMQSISYTRSCNNPHPSPEGKECEGESEKMETKSCHEHDCPVINGNWSGWKSANNWSACSVSCGGGKQLKVYTRSCDNPHPSPGGNECDGESVKVQSVNCNEQACSADTEENNETTNGNGSNGTDGKKKQCSTYDDSEVCVTCQESTSGRSNSDLGRNICDDERLQLALSVVESGTCDAQQDINNGSEGSEGETGTTNENESSDIGETDGSAGYWKDDMCLANSMRVCPTCTDRQLIPLLDCTKYHECSEGKLETKSCGTSEIWNQDTQACENVKSLTCHICPNGEKYPHMEACNMYYECITGFPEKRTCEDNKSFDRLSKCCVETDQINLNCDKCVDNDMFIDPSHCEKYFTCSNGNLYEMSCPTSLVFNPEISVCDYKQSHCAICLNGQFYEHLDCHKYFECDNGTLIEKDCPNGMKWNKEKLQCILECNACVDGWAYQDDDCSKYYDCSGGEGQLKSCQSGYIWNQRVSRCVLQLPQFENCTACEDEEFYVHTSCKKYYVCTNGEPVLRECSQGTLFNLDNKECRYNSHRPDCNL